jgi:hypothetical protein
MTRLLVATCLAALPAFALAGSSETQAPMQRDACYAQYKYQGYTKKHQFSVDCRVTLSRKDSSKSWFQVDSAQSYSKILWKPSAARKDTLAIKCSTDDPLITGEEYIYTKEQVPTQQQLFEKVVALRDGGPMELASLPAFAQRDVVVKNAEQQLDFIVIQGKAEGRNGFAVKSMAYPSSLALDGQEPHYSQSLSPAYVADIPLDDVVSQSCADFNQPNATEEWLPDGSLKTITR